MRKVLAGAAGLLLGGGLMALASYGLIRWYAASLPEPDTALAGLARSAALQFWTTLSHAPVLCGALAGAIAATYWAGPRPRDERVEVPIRQRGRA